MNTPPETMTAIDPEQPGGPEVLVAVERPVPRPGPGEVLIEVAAAGVNRPDVMQRLGLYPPPAGAPTIPGLEVAGTIVGLGPDVPPEQLGQPVCALVAGGGYAQFCAAPMGQCLPVPPALTMVEAAALPEALFTVWHNLFERAYAREGEAVLVHGGTSGIGTTAILLGKLFGLTVIVTAGSNEKCIRALEIGAAHAIDYGTQDFVEEVKRITGGRGVDVVLDMIGGDYVPRNLACLAEDGRHVSIAAQRGAKAELALWPMMAKRLTLTGSTLRARSTEFKALLAQEIERNVWPAVEQGEFRPVIDSIFPLGEAAEAHRRMESSEHVGKIVLEVGEKEAGSRAFPGIT
jgi:putative PIG3 family NAD(P)H quinone oxidoreductase